MTGAYLRVRRNGKWENVEVEHLTDEERYAAFKNRPHMELMNWLHTVCNRLADIENAYFATQGSDKP
jgi:hypothetical protein